MVRKALYSDFDEGGNIYRVIQREIMEIFEAIEAGYDDRENRETELNSIKNDNNFAIFVMEELAVLYVRLYGPTPWWVWIAVGLPFIASIYLAFVVTRNLCSFVRKFHQHPVVTCRVMSESANA
ncbi:hypothetical protein RF11_05843 [Thelohanellus kitauei]|uniref:Uncharacterized protein n=1 Tax=Thelohanellus kitauei TaxID=669202 RepID=A0A0C2I7F6_THEKT|nr:hypothetical protein RF11_05843 [Thelohanellus kitauei]